MIATIGRLAIQVWHRQEHLVGLTAASGNGALSDAAERLQALLQSIDDEGGAHSNGSIPWVLGPLLRRSADELDDQTSRMRQA